ncbi:MAG: hypothetical protein ACLGIW_00430 [Gammaproteobacteria bacterium]
MNKTVEDSLVETLLAHLPRDLCMSLDDGFSSAARRAFSDTAQRHDGHRASCLGIARHQHQNEVFAQALDASSIPRNPLRGNDIIVGQVGPLLLGRFSVSSSTWNNVRRSQRRLNLAQSNLWLERLVQPELFGQIWPVEEARVAVFFVSVFSGSLAVQPEQPLAVQIVVPDSSLTSQLFCEPLSQFAARFALPAPQEDMARPRLKKAAEKTKTGTDGSQT